MILYHRFLIFLFGYILDVILKDPDFALHPVRLMGYTASFFKELFYKNKKTHGIICYGLLIILWISLGFIIEAKANIFIKIAVFYFMIAPNQLAYETESILVNLKNKNIEEARKILAHLVTRETEEMDQEHIVLTSIETLSENLVDAFISPTFYFFLLGFPALFLYKITETCDSMFGYKTEEYYNFGWIFAKADDLLNFIPARITVLIISIFSLIMGKSPLKPLKWAKEFGSKHESFNAGYPEASFSALLGVSLGGYYKYFGKKVFKPYIGKMEEEPDIHILEKAIIYFKSICLFVILFISILVAVLKG